LQEKAQGLVQVGVAFELAANRILANRPDNRLFFEDGPVFVVELKFDLDDLVFFNAMQTGNRKADAATGNVVDMNDPAAHASLAENFVGAIQAGLFAVGPAKIKQDGKNLLAAATNRNDVPLMMEATGVKMFDGPAGRTDECRGIVFSNVNFYVRHGDQS
jgi:hypothetical protein